MNSELPHNRNADSTSEGGTPGQPVKFGHSPNRQREYDHRFWPPRWPKLTKKEWIITVIISVLLIGSGVGAYFVWLKPKPKPTVTTPKKVTKTVQNTVPAQPKLVSKLTGLPISDAAVNTQPVTAVMIENSLDARPQSGIDQAGVVFEAIAEGGITRFLTLYQDTAPTYVGPVRSVRPYYLEWLSGFDAPVAHVGGSGEALNDIKVWGLKDLDQFYNSAYYHRISSRYAPHNVYTSLDQLHALERAKGITTSNYTGFKRKDAAAPSKTPWATSINFNISGYYYNVHYDYDTATNTYKRSEGGAPHMAVDENGNKTQITPSVVVGMVMPQGIEADDLHTSYNTIGSGPAYIFQDGIAINGTWHKANRTEQFTFTDEKGAEIALNPGKTWLTALGSTNYVSYK